MSDAFADEATEEFQRRGLRGLLSVSAHAAGDLAVSALSATIERGRRRPRAQPATTSKGALMRASWQDVRYGARMLWRQPGFALAAVATLSIGVGANTAVFTLVNGALLRPLPYDGADQVVRIWGVSPGAQRANVNPVDAMDWGREVTAFESLSVLTTSTQPLTGIGDPVAVPVGFVSSGFFHTLRISAGRGRLFGAEHAAAGHENDVVVSDRFWRNTLSADPAVLGRRIRLSDVPCTIIGVLPGGFASPGSPAGAEPQIWRPYVVNPENGRGGHFMRALARLTPGASLAEAQAQLDAVTERLAREHPSTNFGQRARLEPLQTSITGDTRPALLLLMAAVSVVLLIACANVANLLLARGSVRQREVALRGALGATRTRVVRQLLTESLVLSGIACLGGVLLALLAMQSLPAWVRDELPTVMSSRLDARVLAFTGALSVVTALVFGSIPALQVSRVDLRGALAQGGRTGPAGSRGFQSALLVLETALALVLFVAASLLVRSFLKLQHVDPGFDTERVLTFRIELPRARYATPAAGGQFFDRLIAGVAALPGVAVAGGVNMAPLSPRHSCDSFGLADRPAPPEGQEPCAESRVATSGYFQAMGIPLIAGRHFLPADGPDTARVILVSETLANTYWPRGGALGQRFKWGSVTSADPWRTIVGVVGDVKHFGLDADAAADVYMPMEQVGSARMTVAVRTARDPDALRAEIRPLVGLLDPALPMLEVFSTRELVDRSTAPSRFRTELLAAFALIALGLATVGVYGVMAFFVSQRTQEIGIRLALGARASEVRWLVVRGAMTSAGLGILLGAGGALAAARLLEQLLFGVDPVDPLSFVLAPIVLLATALGASYVPARRATRLDPLAALRTE
jgi:putative ABC transport system permease protein